MQRPSAQGANQTLNKNNHLSKDIHTLRKVCLKIWIYSQYFKMLSIFLGFSGHGFDSTSMRLTKTEWTGIWQTNRYATLKHRLWMSSLCITVMFAIIYKVIQVNGASGRPQRTTLNGSAQTCLYRNHTGSYRRQHRWALCYSKADLSNWICCNTVKEVSVNPLRFLETASYWTHPVKWSVHKHLHTYAPASIRLELRTWPHHLSQT